METTRAAFLSRGARGGIALVAGGSVLAATTGNALGARSGDNDIAKLAATAELLAIDFYSKALASKKFNGAEAAYMAAALQNEKDHYKALAGVLKSAAPKRLMFAYPVGTFASAKSIGKLGQALETALRRRLPRCGHRSSKSNDLKGVRGNDRRQRIAPPGNPLQHRGAGRSSPGPSFPKALTAASGDRRESRRS